MSAQRTLHLQWFERASRSLVDGNMDHWIATELHNLAWHATIDAIARYGHFAEASRVLDVGFGWGRVVLGLKKEFPDVQLDGIELTPEFVDKANDLVASMNLDNVNLVQGDIYQYRNEGEPYDLVYATRVLHYLDDKVAALSNMHAALRPGGRLVVLVPNRWCPAQWVSYRHGLYSPRKLMDDVRQAGFEEVKFRSIRFLPGAVAGRLGHDSPVRYVERALQRTPPTRWMGALAIITARRAG